MLFVVIFVYSICMEKTFPSDFVEYVDSIISLILFVSNFFFYFSETEYDVSSSSKPFLHTWV